MGSNQVGRNHAGLRKRMGLFARLRSANRAMPAAAAEIADSELQEQRAAQLRETLADLAGREAPPKALADELNARLGDIDQELQAMNRELVDRFDAIPFVSLRAAIPRAVETHRKEVVSLLEVLLSDRAALSERLHQVEYLITMLATDEEDGRRNIQHDPVGLTPMLENFTVDTLEPADAEAIAMELYQAATLDSESENFSEILRSLRARKHELGLGCLCPVVLRAVVTYNARMFNSVSSIAEASRASDSLLDEELGALDASVDASETGDGEEFVEPTNETASGASDADADCEDLESESEASRDDSIPVSVFDSSALESVIDSLRIRLEGGQVGRRGPQERIAVILDQGSLEALESEALLAESRTSEQDVVARTTVIGLMLRDLGPLQDPLAELGITQTQLCDQWVRELNETFGQMLSQMLADPKAYEMTSRLSGIKTKHLLKPFKALNSPSPSSSATSMGGDTASQEMRAIARAAAADSSGSTARVRSVPGGVQRDTADRFGLGNRQTKVIAAAALVALAVGLTLANIVGIAPSDIKTMKPAALRVTSPYLSSAYRNEKGRGPLMIGRVDALFVELPIEEKIAAAEEMVENFEIQGIDEAMFYDDRGTMQVQFAAGELFRPRLGDRSTGHRPGESAVRRTLSGQRLDEIESSEDEEEDDWGDY